MIFPDFIHKKWIIPTSKYPVKEKGRDILSTQLSAVSFLFYKENVEYQQSQVWVNVLLAGEGLDRELHTARVVRP